MSYLDLAKQAEARLNRMNWSRLAQNTRPERTTIGQSATVLANDREISEESEATSVVPTAKALLDRLLGQGYTFRTLQHNGQDLLLWFGPRATPEALAEVAQHKNELVRLLQGGQAGSTRTWGEPTEDDWSRHLGSGPAMTQ